MWRLPETVAGRNESPSPEEGGFGGKNEDS